MMDFLAPVFLPLAVQSLLRPKKLRGYGCPYLFAQILPDNLLNLLPGALWSLAVQHFEGAGVLLRQQIVKRSQVLSHLDEGASVGAAQLPEALSRAQVHLRRDQNISQALLLSVTCTHPHTCLLFVQYLNRSEISLLDLGHHHHLMCQINIRGLALFRGTESGQDVPDKGL